jgi:cytochrome c-type biogenesis protein CcmE
VARPTRSPARLIVALSVAAILAIFLVYTAIAGTTPSLKPSQLASQTGKVAVAGRVVGPVQGDSHTSAGLRFGMRDPGKNSGPMIRVVYHGDSPPPLFAVGRDVVVSGVYAHGQLSGKGLMTKCPSKYAPAKTTTSSY